MKLKSFRPFGRMIVLWATGMLMGFSIGCSSSTDPDIVTEGKLKSPFNMLAVDEGNGTITLFWSANNYESDFDGYNIYGAKLASISSLIDGTKIKKGKPLQLLDEDGVADTSAKTFLEAMSYNVDTPFEAKGEKSAEEKDFQFFPIQAKKDVFPTCRPGETTDSACTALTEAVASHVEREFAGITSYQITGLTVGTEYCFLALSSLNAGKTVSPTSTELTCVIPKHKGTKSLSVEQNQTQKIALETLRAACTGTTDCMTDTTFTAASGYCASTEEALCVDRFGSSGITNLFHLTPGTNSAIKNLGTYASGFTTQKQLFTEAVTSFGDSLVVPGYIPKGQSSPVATGQIWSVVTKTTVDSAIKYYYDFVYIKSANTDTNTIELEILFSKNVGESSTVTE